MRSSKGAASLLLLIFTFCSLFPDVQASIQAGLPVLSRTGNTTKYVSAAAAFAGSKCLESDVNGNAAEAAGACATASQQHSIGFTYGTAGTAITTGEMFGMNPTAAFACTISRYDISGYPSGSITVDVWKAAGATPTSGDKISASAPMTLSSSRLSQNGSRTGWTNSVSSGDVFGFSVATATTTEVVVGQLWCN